MEANQKYQEILAILRQTHTDVLERLDPIVDSHHRLHMDTQFKRMIDRIAFSTGAGPSSHVTVDLPPAKTIGGEQIKVSTAVSLDDLTPQEDALTVLRRKVEEGYKEFLNLTDDQILSTVDNMVIRGIAKRMNMEVTETTPAMNKKFVQAIKKQIGIYRETYNERLAAAKQDLEAATTDEAKEAAQKVIAQLESWPA